MIYINLLEIILILLIIVLFAIWKKRNKNGILKILRIIVLIGFLLVFFPYSLVLSFSSAENAFKFFNGRSQIIGNVEQDKQIVFIYKKRKDIGFSSYYKKEERWKENIITESGTKRENINSNDYEIKTFNLDNGKKLVVILKNNDKNNLGYEAVHLDEEEIRNYNYESNKLYYGIMEKVNYIVIENNKIKL